MALLSTGLGLTDGYEIEGGEITGSAVTDKEDYHIYLVKDGKIVEKDQYRWRKCR